MPRILWAFAAGLMLHCHQDEKLPDVSTGLVVDIDFNTTAMDKVSGTQGLMHQVLFTADRHQQAANAAYFNSRDSATILFANLPGASFVGNVFTISLWVKREQNTINQALLSKRLPTGPWEYSIDNHFSSGSYSFDNWVSNGAGTVYGIDPLKAAINISPGKWQHLAFVANGSTLIAYADGVLAGGTDQRNVQNNFEATGAPLIIGNGGNWGKNHYFTGTLDDLKMFNRALTAPEIKVLAEY